MIAGTHTHWGLLTPLISADGVIWLSAAIRRFLESVDDNFLVQLIQKLTGKGTLPDLLLTNKEKSHRDVKIKGSLGYSNCQTVAFKILREVRKTHCMVTTQDFRRAEFSLFRDLPGRISWKTALEGKGKAQES